MATGTLTERGVRDRRAARARAWLVPAAIAVLLLGVATVARVAYLEATPGYTLRHDAVDYDGHARSIALDRGFSPTLAHGRPTAFRPPAYPYFLAGVYKLAGVERAGPGRRVHAARVAGVVVGVGIVALVGLLAAQLFGTIVGLVTLGLAAIYVPLITVGGSVMSEPLSVLLMLGSLCAAVAARTAARAGRGRWAWPLVVLAGGLAGLTILSRANAVVLLLPLALAVWTGRPRWSWRALAAPVVVVAVALATLTPWTVRNFRVFHAFIPVSTQLGSAMAGTYNDQAREDRDNPASWRSVSHVPQYASLWAAVRRLPEPVLERRLREASLDYIGQHPAYVLEVGFWNTVRMLDLAGRRRSRETAATITIDHRWADRTVWCFWVLALLAIAGACTAAARRAPWWLWLLPVLLVLSVVFLTLETPRYRTPVDPFVVLLAALAVTAAGRRAGRALRR